jgi:hypothetical protein
MLSMIKTKHLLREKLIILLSEIMIDALERVKPAFFIMASSVLFVDFLSKSDMAKLAMNTLRFTT